MSKAIKVGIIGLLAVLTLTIIIFGNNKGSLDLVVAVNKWRLPDSFKNVQDKLAPFCHDLVGDKVIHHPNCKKSDMVKNDICGIQNEFAGRWDSSFLEASPKLAAKNVSSTLNSMGCKHIVVDFEGVTVDATILEKWLSEFLGELRPDFKLSIAAYAKNQEQVSNELANRQRYKFLCSEFDEIWLMTYDYSIPPWTGIG
ncbi:MAG: hypothetical protein KC478_08820, partial [Bacteriovoracaceae bacterium]|nr:hypothetical protein [Bacteriovoracaceae bacterium]